VKIIDTWTLYLGLAYSLSHSDKHGRTDG